jgi:mevalonate pyrophosphate decarboxylase
MKRKDVYAYFMDTGDSMKLFCTRRERYLIYKHLKGKDCPLKIYSYGKENTKTQKKMIIKCK